MYSSNSNGSRAAWALGFMALWAALVLAAGDGASAAPVETVLYSFTGGSDGNGPAAGLIADSSGNLYGTTGGGGALANGVVFKVAPGGTEAVLYSFKGGSDGAGPLAGLIADSSGNFYGTTESGGASGNGVVFKLTPGGVETVLHSFTGGTTDGANPEAGLIADSSGNLYGTTDFGGAHGQGTVFKLAPGGAETVLYSFAGGSDGANPLGGLIADKSGNFYGTTSFGGASNVGVVFKLTPGGAETVLYTFCKSGSCTDGETPKAGLIADSGGNFYGTTSFGGTSGNGVVFKLTPGGTETVLYSFKGGSDGEGTTAGVIADKRGNLYGTTLNGGVSGNGVVFRLSPGGTETELYSLCSKLRCSDGAGPFAGLIADSDGNLYGTTFQGGTLNSGTVFKLTGTGFAIVPPPAYVTNTGSGTVSVLDTLTNTVAAAVTVGVKPEGTAVTPNGQHAYVANAGSNTVSSIDAATNTVAATVTVGVKPKGVAVAPNGKHAYVTNSGSNTVSVIKTSTNTVAATIGVGTSPFGVAFTPDGTHAYVANKGSNNVSVIATATKTVTTTVTVGLKPVGVAVTPDGTHAYVANAGSNNVSVILTATNKVVATITVGLKPQAVAVTPDGTQAYVANAGTNTVSVIDTSINAVAATIPVGILPLGIAFSLNGKHVYVANGGSGDVSVIRTAKKKVVATVAVGTDPTGVGIMP